MSASLRRLAALEGDFAVYPGHGETTTLAIERTENPYLQMALKQG
jgi:glyoxylase-like metal-dependent hydrolase (beta-lactamase superfamily II)